MSFLSRLFGDEKRQRRHLESLYGGIVAAGRDPAWYLEGEVADTIDGRFDVIAAVLTMVLLRLEQEGDATKQDSVLLTELFVADMDGSIRQMGIGDLMVGKHIGRMMSALGGRLAAFRAGGAGPLDAPVARNIFHDSPPSAAALAFVAGRFESLRDRLAAIPAHRLLAGEMPAL